MRVPVAHVVRVIALTASTDALLAVIGMALTFVIVLLVFASRLEQMDAVEYRRSNARVIKEVKRIALYEPRKLYETQDQERNYP